MLTPRPSQTTARGDIVARSRRRPGRFNRDSMQDVIADIIDSHGVVILDGGMATELESRGADLNGPLWSAKALLETPQLIEQVHYDYYAAGADIAVSASYQATF